MSHYIKTKNDKLSEDRDDYRRAFHRQVFQLVKWAYEKLDSSQYKSSEEEDITGDLVYEIDEILQDRSSPDWVIRYFVREDPRVKSDTRKGKRRKKLDIEIIRSNKGVRPRMQFEAKRLATGHHPIGKYLGNEGLGEYLIGNYSADQYEAAMLGYIQTNTPEYWACQAEKKLNDSPECYQVCEDCSWSNLHLIDGHEHSYFTKHHRLKGKSPIRILHFFLLFL